MKVLIHADGGPGVGLGHVARCSALANAFFRRGHQAAVAVDPGRGLVDYVQRQGATVIPSGASAREVSEAAGAMAADCLVVDSYQWTEDDFRAAQGNWSLVAFDDQALRVLPVDAVINGAPGAAELRYQTADEACLLLGPTYQVVRDDFRIMPVRGEAGVVGRVIALVGGDDPLGLLPVLARILQLTAEDAAVPFKAELICGPFMPLPALQGMSHVDVIRDPPDLKDRMARADLAISAAGQSLYELARCGTPTIAFCSGQDQVHNLAALAAEGVVLDAGDATQPEWPQKIKAGLLLLAGDGARRTAMSRAGQALIDGFGSDRLAEVITSLGATCEGAGRDSGVRS